MSDYHPESWNPMWSVASILTGLQSFFYEDVPTTGSVAAAPHERRALAAASLEHNARVPLFAKARATRCAALRCAGMGVEGGREGASAHFVLAWRVSSHCALCPCPLRAAAAQMFGEVIEEQRALRAARAPPPPPPPPPDADGAAAGSPAAPSAAAAAALSWSAAHAAQAASQPGAPQGQQAPHAPPPLPPHAGAPHPLGGAPGDTAAGLAHAQPHGGAGGATWLARLGALAVFGGVLAVLAVPLLSLELSAE
jgi:hypothetical protein